MIQTYPELIEKIEQAGYSVNCDDGECDFGKYSPAGQDFHISVSCGSGLDDLLKNLWEYYSGFDISEETYLWLDEQGHGKNGALYDMRDLYNDMEACEDIIYKLHEIITEFWDNYEEPEEEED